MKAPLSIGRKYLRELARLSFVYLLINSVLFSTLIAPPSQARAAERSASPSDLKQNIVRDEQTEKPQSPPTSKIENAAAPMPFSPPAPPPPDGITGRVIYPVGNAYSEAFVMINPDGSNAVNLTDLGSAQIYYQSVSQQTGLIAFESGSIQITPPLAGRYDNRVFVMNADGSGVRQVTFYPGQGDLELTGDHRPQISPDGTKIAFVSYRARTKYNCTNSSGSVDTQREVYVVNTDGTNLHQVTTPQFADRYDVCEASDNYTVAWGPDSQQLAVLGRKPYNFQQLNGQRTRNITTISIVNADGTNEHNILYSFIDPNHVEPVTSERLGTDFVEWAPGSDILFQADYGDPFHANYENSGSIGRISPSGGAPSVTLAQTLMGVVGYNGSTDGNPHGGAIVTGPNSVRYSPDGAHILFAGRSPRANNGEQMALFIDNGANPIPNTQGFFLTATGLAWAPGPAIPKPDKLVLTPNPVILHDLQKVQVTPTLLDAQGNVIVRSALWRDFFNSCPTCGFRCDNAPGLVSCRGSGQANQVDFTGVVTGRDGDGTNNLCASNAGLQACTVVENYNTALLSVEVKTPTASTATGSPAIITVKRSGNPNSSPVKDALTFNFALGGTGRRGIDYALDIPDNSITIPAGQPSIDIQVRPLNTTGDKTVDLIIEPDQTNSYFVSSGNKASVTIKDTGSSAALYLTSMTPNAGGDQGVVTATIFGQNINPNATVKLVRDGQPDIVGQNVIVAASGTSVTAMFNLFGRQRGAWNLVMQNPNDAPVTLVNALTIQGSTEPRIWVDISGHGVIRASHTASTYTLTFGNSGNVDAYMVPLFVTGIPKGAEVKTLFDVQPIPGQAAEDAVPPLISNDQMQGIAVVMPVVRANTTNYLRFTIRMGVVEDATYTLKAIAMRPLVEAVGSKEAADGPKFTSRAARESGASPQDSASDGVYFQANRKAIACMTSIILDGLGCLLGNALKVQQCALNAAALAISLVSTLGQALVFGRGDGQSATDSIAGIKPLSTGSLAASLFGVAISCLKALGAAVPAYAWISALGCALSVANDIKTAFWDDGCGVGLATKDIKGVKSADPNEKIGSTGTGPQHYVSTAEPLHYTIYFENKAEASAPAQTVVVTDQLDPAKVDFSTLSLGLIGFGDRVVNVPAGRSFFDADVDLRPEQNLIVRIHAALDVSTGVLTWKFQSIDPATNQPTTDPLAGFLPPNKIGVEGEGSVLFSIKPKAGLGMNTTITNQARITFDLNAPIDTNVFTNTIDNAKPTGQINALPATQNFTSFTVTWGGTDDGSGAQSYDVYVSENNAAFTPWLTDTRHTSQLYFGKPGSSYAFYAVARDAAGNRQDVPTSAQATTQVADSAINFIDDAQQFVRQQYLDFLNREPDPPGLDFWTKEITVCNTDAKCVDRKRVNTSGAYFLSTEFQSTGYFVYRLYKGALGRLPRYSEFINDVQQLSVGVVVNNQLSDAAIENNKNAYAAQFINRQDFKDVYAALDNAGFVDKLTQTRAVALSDSDRQALIDGLGGGTETRASVLRKVLDGTTTVNNGKLQFTTTYGKAFYDKEYNPAFVLMQYFGYLRRDPDADGYAFWLKKLNDYKNFIDAEMVRSFIVSDEYRRRFGIK